MSTSCYSWDMDQDDSSFDTSKAITRTSTVVNEKLEMLLEDQDNNDEMLQCIDDARNKTIVPESTPSNHCPRGRVSVVTFSRKHPSLAAVKEVKGDTTYHSPKKTRSLTFSGATVPLSPLNRKRQSSISRMKHKAYELKASFAFLIVAITYMFTWLPVVALTFDEVLGNAALPESLAIISLYTIAVNALSDPFLYGLLLPNFRKTLRIMLSRLKGGS